MRIRLKRSIKRIRGYLKEILMTKSTAHSLALGCALGTFISILPTPLINIWFGFVALFIFPRASKFTLFFSLLFWNPITVAPFNVLSYEVGNMIVGPAISSGTDLTWFQQLYKVSGHFLLGSLVVSTVISIINYYGLKYLILYLRKIKWHKRESLREMSQEERE